MSFCGGSALRVHAGLIRYTEDQVFLEAKQVTIDLRAQIRRRQAAMLAA